MHRTMTVKGFLVILSVILAVFLCLHLLNLVGTDSYIISSARENYAFLKEGEIRFEFSNPGALYTYSEEELRILVDEVAD